jgi:hypothetical protein
LISLGGGSFASTDIGTDGGTTPGGRARPRSRSSGPASTRPTSAGPSRGSTTEPGAFHARPIAHQLGGPDAGHGRGRRRRGDFYYYSNSAEAGSISDFSDSQDDYGTTQPSCYEFRGAGSGKGVCVKNNAASVWNRTGKTVRV